MELTTSIDGPVAVIGCVGRLDLTAAPRLKAEVEEVLGGPTTHVVVDLAQTSFIDSSGLGALVSGLKTARQAGGDLRIAAAGDQVRTVLSLTNLDRILKPHATVEDARDGW